MARGGVREGGTSRLRLIAFSWGTALKAATKQLSLLAKAKRATEERKSTRK